LFHLFGNLFSPAKLWCGTVFFIPGAFLLRCAPQKPRFSGLRYRSGPACGVAAAPLRGTHPYNRLRGLFIRRLRGLKASFTLKVEADFRFENLNPREVRQTASQGGVRRATIK
jgi:hypothetical protein